jgi:putative endonuclease
VEQSSGALELSRLSLARWGEEVAWRALERQGYRLLARNWRSPEGELDLVARLGETIVFIEVKARQSIRYGAPEDAVTPAKLRRLRSVAQAFLQAEGWEGSNWRIDVVAVECDAERNLLRLEQFPDVFQDD